MRMVLNITKVVSKYHINRRGGAEQFLKLCILYCVCTQCTHSQCSLTFAGQITEYTEGQMHVCTKSYLGIGIEADAAGIGIPASCISVRYRSILKKKQDGAFSLSRGLTAFSAGLGILDARHSGALISFLNLKVLTNEKRGGLNLVSSDWSCFKLFTLKFSKESVQTLSCERHKTAQRTLFLSFKINYCFPITA